MRKSKRLPITVDRCNKWVVLGQILFLIYINEIQNICKLFANDAKLFYPITKEPSMLQPDIDSLNTWSGKWQLPFNVGKCKVLHIGKNNPEHNYHMNGRILEKIDFQNDLGVLMDTEINSISKHHRQSKKQTKS